ncbi:MAG: hypothetical protein PF637_05015 [Spirochaetes bacterium]|jgi:predicted small lipoprotein YifL|nr:hypothetical protein [Spirochaetota bacterium]
MKKVLLSLAALFLAVTFVACGASVPSEMSVDDGASPAAIAAEISKTLEPVVIDEFAFNSARVPSLNGIAMIYPVISSAQKAVPAGFVLAIVGHNDKFEAKGGIGYRRGKAVMYELRALGLNVSNVKAVNGYNKDMVAEKDVAAPVQRRVTFRVVKK